MDIKPIFVAAVLGALVASWLHDRYHPQGTEARLDALERQILQSNTR